MTPNQISQDDLILYALQDLTPDEAAEITSQLERSASAREELAQIHADLSAYALTSELHSPPVQARDRFLRQVSKEKKLAPAEAVGPSLVSGHEEPVLRSREDRVVSIDSVERPRSSGMGFLGWAGWAVAACCAAAAGLEYRQHQALQQTVIAQDARLDDATQQAARAQKVMQLLTDGGAMQVSLRQVDVAKEPPKPVAHAAYAADTGSLVFVAMHLQPLETAKTYQLWVIPADGKAPIPAGTFKPNLQGFASVVMPDLPKGVVAGQLGVTIEEDGGSKTPTMPIVLAGA